MSTAYRGTDYEYQSSFILGFHGCDREVGEQILSGDEPELKPSEKAYDWLGHGIYFWEGNLARAWAWAEGRKDADKIKEPFVLGAIIDLQHCLDLFSSEAMQMVRTAHAGLDAVMAAAQQPMPQNVGSTPDKAGRRLDCMVMNTLHTLRREEELASFDSVRGPFLEGEPVYEGAGFRSEVTSRFVCARWTASRATSARSCATAGQVNRSDAWGHVCRCGVRLTPARKCKVGAPQVIQCPDAACRPTRRRNSSRW
jgi:hypothetical protein